MKILFFTGSRAEYYIIRPLLIKLMGIPKINVALIVSGGILKEDNLNTIKDIHKDGIYILEEIKLPYELQNHSEIIGYLSLRLPKLIQSYIPDLTVVYGDRYESFAYAIACTHGDVPLLHLEAGDITEGGTYDDYIRHCISKMSHLFCTSTKKGKFIVNRLGEENWRVIHSGLLSYEDIKMVKEEDKKLVLDDLSISDNIPLILVTMHPLPKDLNKTKIEIESVLKSLIQISNHANVNIIITSPNSDYGNQIIKDQIQKYLKFIKNAIFVESLGGLRYHTLMSLSSDIPVVVCGNSSSVIKEAPYYNANSLNIGDRQKGREKSTTQVDCAAHEETIFNILKKLISYKADSKDNPYFLENTSDRVCNFIQKIFSTKTKIEILDKKWNHSINFENNY